MAKDEGKIFEAEIKSSFPSDFFIERYKDDTAGFYGVSNPADFRLYKYPLTFLLELKTHKGKSIPLAKIRDNQVQGMHKAVQHKGVYGGFILNYRELEETYYISVQLVVEFINAGERKSIPVSWCRENGIRVAQTKKRVRYSYDIASLLGRYFNEQS
jgi:recombination protein U